MKSSIFLSAILLIGVASDVVAGGCEDAGYTTGPLDQSGIMTALSGKQILAEAPDGEEWNEDHCASGALYKLEDPENPVVDPRARRGTWMAQSAAGRVPASVRYNYDSSGFSWSLWENSSGGLCWESLSNNELIATAPAPTSAGNPCD